MSSQQTMIARCVLALIPLFAFQAACDTVPDLERRFAGSGEISRFVGDAEAPVQAALGPFGLEVNRVTMTYRGLATEAIHLVVMDGDLARSLVVLPTGEILSPSEAADREADAYRARFGKMTEAMWSRYADSSPHGMVEFIVLLDGDFIEPELPYDGTDMRVPYAEFEEWTLERRVAQRARLDQVKTPVRAALEDLGATLDVDYESLPMMRFTGPASLMESDFILNDPRIVRLHAPQREGEEGTLLGYAGHASMNEAVFNGQGGCSTIGCTGQQMAVGLWEEEAAYINYWPGIASKNHRYATNSATYLHNPPTCSTDMDCPSTALLNRTRCRTARVTGYPITQKFCVQEHLSYVAASLGMKGDYTYAAGELGPNAVTFSNGVGAWDVVFHVGNESDVQGLNYILSTSASYVNRSQDQAIGDSADGIDWAARYDGVLTTLSSGNTGTSPVVCGAVWNGICVGAYRYENWVVPSTHRRWTRSGYINGPIISGLERPHLLGPGTHYENDGLHMPDIRLDTNDTMLKHPLDGTSYQIYGTSFAAPAILGFAIQAHQYEGWFSNLAHPIVKKAVLMAGSRDSNADGPIKNGQEWSSASDGEDGAGHPWGTWVKQILDSNQYTYRSLSNSSFVSCGTGCREYTVASTVAPTNGRIKTALVWNACNTSQTGTAQLVNDLDLVLVRPSGGSCGGTLHQSVSTVSEVEMVYDDCLLVPGLEVPTRSRSGSRTACRSNRAVLAPRKRSL